MLDKLRKIQEISTPALIYNLELIQQRLELLQSLRKEHAIKIYYSIKSASFQSLLTIMQDYVDGYSVSSLFEARLIAETFAHEYKVHMTSPGGEQESMKELASYCDAISINSISQWQGISKQQSLPCSIGLRLNPETEFGLDERYDPCRRHSKLGLSINTFIRLYKDKPESFQNLQGLHIHNNCQSTNTAEFAKTLQVLEPVFELKSLNLKWLNLGGGYIIKDRNTVAEFSQILMDANLPEGMEVILEPGKGIVGDAGYLLSSVQDVFDSEGRKIAILDTTVNHLPEVFEYQYQPEIENQQLSDGVSYRLAGNSCLSGDIFGDYNLNKQPEKGVQILFKDVGAYMYVKASMFNGIPLPSVYLMHSNGELECIKSQTYEDYLRIYQ